MKLMEPVSYYPVVFPIEMVLLQLQILTFSAIEPGMHSLMARLMANVS